MKAYINFTLLVIKNVQHKKVAGKGPPNQGITGTMLKTTFLFSVTTYTENILSVNKKKSIIGPLYGADKIQI